MREYRSFTIGELRLLNRAKMKGSVTEDGAEDEEDEDDEDEDEDRSAVQARALAGYAAVFNSDSEDLGGFIERIAPGAFNKSLAGADNIFALWSHDWSQPLGSTRGGKLQLASDANGLNFTLDTTRFTPAQLDASADGELRMSFGFQVNSETWTEREGDLPLRVLNDVTLMEVSPVTLPAYPDTSAALRSLKAWKEQHQTTLASETDKYPRRVRINCLKKLTERK